MYLRNTIISILSFLSLLLNAEEPKTEIQQIQEWIILKNKTTAYQNKELTIASAFPIFNYKEKVFGVLLKDSLSSLRSWVVEVMEGNKILYFPFPEIIQNNTIPDNGNYQIGKEEVDILNPLAFDYKPTDLVQLEQIWNFHETDYPKLIRKEAYEALIKMLEVAKSVKIHLKVVSAFRDFEKQRSLYLLALKNKGIHQIGTAKPAHSEHQLGTTVDLTSENRKDPLSLSFDQTLEGKWLQENAHKFGFIQSYTKENAKKKGYMPEPWHFRYVGPNLKNHDSQLH